MIVRMRNPFSLLRRKVSFRFDTFAYFKICELNEIEIDELDTLTEQHIFLSWMYAAYISDCAYNYRKPRYDFNYITKIYRWYYVNDSIGIDKLKTAMLQSKLVGKEVAVWADREGVEKKK